MSVCQSVSNYQSYTALNIIWQFGQKFYHSCLANLETLPLKTNRTSKKKKKKKCGRLRDLTAESAAQANNELRNMLTPRDLQSIAGAVCKYYNIALINRIPGTYLDALTDPMHRILQHVTAHKRHSHKVHHLET